MPGLIKKHEFFLLTIIAGMLLVIAILNRSFFSLGNIFDVLKSSVIIGIFAMGVFIVLLSGNIDISHTAIAAFSMYVTASIIKSFPAGDHIVLIFLLSGLIGGLLGSMNAVFIHYLKLPGLIVTLGSAGMIRGFLLAFVGTRIITVLPDSMIRFSKANLFQQVLGAETIGLSVSIFILVAVVAGVAFLLKYTLLGRGIYAIGGAHEAASRAGFNIGAIQFFIYGFVGFLSGIAGIIHASYVRNANPFDIVGLELNVIAAVVLGGADITGGKGTVTGTILGVFILVIINKSLILVGVPSLWQKVVVGVVILVSVAITAHRTARIKT